MYLRFSDIESPRETHTTNNNNIRDGAESSKEEQNSEEQSSERSSNSSLSKIIGEDVAVCGTCSSMFGRLGSLELFGEGRGPHHKSNAALIKAASSGCRICKPLLHHCQRVSGSHLDCVSEKWRYKIWSKKRI